MDEREKIQVVINTLETLVIPATRNNVGRLAGIYNILDGIVNGEGEDGREADTE